MPNSPKAAGPTRSNSPSRPSDIPGVVALIRALADFEHLPGPDADAARRLEEHALAGACYELLVPKKMAPSWGTPRSS